jgi:undecaprenyl diphosphate synthase
MQSALERKVNFRGGLQKSLHVAVIMDGNGRWATRRGLPRTAGHRAGVETVRRIVEAASDIGITTLTLFAFSSDNWRRPDDEVGALMALLESYLRAEVRRLARSGARLTVIGRRDRLPGRLARDIAAAELATAHGRRLHLRVAIDYSAREAIVRAAANLAACHGSRDAFGRLIAQSSDGQECCEVDLLIRTGGEKRLSDFLLWESAYAELWFSDKMWPEFTADDLGAAVDAFGRRERRFGGVGQAAVNPASPTITRPHRLDGDALAVVGALERQHEVEAI